MPLHLLNYAVTFGDCDPAGIVFYPNFPRWFDRTFHDWLRRFGGHAAVCRRLGAKGIGVVSVEARFATPALDGDLLRIGLSVATWDARTVTLGYEVTCGDRAVATARETRGVFVEAEGRTRLAGTAGLREIVNSGEG